MEIYERIISQNRCAGILHQSLIGAAGDTPERELLRGILRDRHLDRHLVDIDLQLSRGAEPQTAPERTAALELESAHTTYLRFVVSAEGIVSIAGLDTYMRNDNFGIRGGSKQEAANPAACDLRTLLENTRSNLANQVARTQERIAQYTDLANEPSLEERIQSGAINFGTGGFGGEGTPGQPGIDGQPAGRLNSGTDGTDGLPSVRDVRRMQ